MAMSLLCLCCFQGGLARYVRERAAAQETANKNDLILCAPRKQVMLAHAAAILQNLGGGMPLSYSSRTSLALVPF